jgi:hypothetical protein
MDGSPMLGLFGTTLRLWVRSSPRMLQIRLRDAVSNFFRWSNTDLTRLLQELDVPIAAINAESSGTDLAALQEYAPSFSVKTMPDVGHIGVIWMKLDLFDRLLTETISDMMLKD